MLLLDVDAEREGFMETVYNILSGDPDNVRANMIIDCYDNLPTVEAVPVVHGTPEPHIEQWFSSDGDLVSEYQVGWECPFCGDAGVKNYCPNCGAKMDGGAEDGKAD